MEYLSSTVFSMLSVTYGIKDHLFSTPFSALGLALWLRLIPALIKKINTNLHTQKKNLNVTLLHMIFTE
ncbi:hypothetical protein BpHYR1_003679 [Brachionus plicatilis]|uniref:Uncharacterized protein n=1 Tax=Brachionus plicatilis TaxID=10195 RepID=A0A3M7SAN8_BRAPC|nr:hypothetical protein BpHYR1_003679 [Brachionus plicatilis]